MKETIIKLDEEQFEELIDNLPESKGNFWLCWWLFCICITLYVILVEIAKFN